MCRAKIYFWLLCVVWVCGFSFSCKEPDAPAVDLTVSHVEVFPGDEVTFTAIGKVAGETKSEEANTMIGYQFSISIDGVSIFTSDKIPDGKLIHSFSDIGVHTISAYVVNGFQKESEAGEVKVTVKEPFVGATWTGLAVNSYYINKPISLSVADVSAFKPIPKQVIWKILKKTDSGTASLDEDGDGYEDTPIWEGKGDSEKLFSATCLGFDKEGEYQVVLVLVDAFSNEKIFKATSTEDTAYKGIFDVKSTVSPIAKFSVAKEGDSVPIYETLVTNLPIDLSSKCTEGETLIFDSALSTSGEGATIESYLWTISKDGQLFSTSTDSVVSIVLEGDSTYGVFLTITNSAGEEDFQNVSLESIPLNTVTITGSLSFPVAPTQWYEGNVYSLTVEASSVSPTKGKIVKIEWIFDDHSEHNFSTSFDAEATVPYSCEFTAPTSILVAATTPYTGKVKATNGCGRVDEANFSINIEDNTPSGTLSLDGLSGVWGDTVGIEVRNTDSPDGVIPTVALELPGVAEKVVLSSSPYTYTYTIPELTGVQKIRAIITNAKGSVVVSRDFAMSQPALFADFDVVAVSDDGKFYVGQTLTLDATSSRNADKSAVSNGNIAWQGVDSKSVAIPAGNFLSTGVGTFTLNVAESGSYLITLTVTEGETTDEYSLSIDVLPNESMATVTSSFKTGSTNIFVLSATNVSTPSGSTAFTYEWFVSNPDPASEDLVSVGTTDSVEYGFELGKTHGVYLHVTNEEGITSQISHDFTASTN